MKYNKSFLPNVIRETSTKDTLVHDLKEILALSGQVYCSSTPESIVYYNSDVRADSVFTVAKKEVKLSFSGSLVRNEAGETIRNNKLARSIPATIPGMSNTGKLSAIVYLASRFMSASYNTTRMLCGASLKVLVDAYGLLPDTLTVKKGIDGETVYTRKQISDAISANCEHWIGSLKGILLDEDAIAQFNPLNRNKQESRNLGMGEIEKVDELEEFEL